jgi:hypothetical protein
VRSCGHEVVVALVVDDEDGCREEEEGAPLFELPEVGSGSDSGTRL